ncbi:MAG: response regulator [Acidobacteria bacterium]|nr:response regulator [Acidobacteriota bacterium]
MIWKYQNPFLWHPWEFYFVCMTLAWSPTTKILVVDDEPSVVFLLKNFLERRGYEVVTASRGDEALAKLKEQSPQIVLLDILLPGGNGLEVLREIRQLEEDIGVIMITGGGDEAAGRIAMENGAFDCIFKPFDLEYLENALCWMLRLSA